MKTIEIFDPAMCCPTGLCGPNINPDLLRIATVVQFLHNQGVPITRHNLRDEPQLYISNQLINRHLQEKGIAGLPVTLVDGKITIEKGYPTNAQLTEWTGIPLDIIPLHK